MNDKDTHAGHPVGYGIIHFYSYLFLSNKNVVCTPSRDAPPYLIFHLHGTEFARHGDQFSAL